MGTVLNHIENFTSKYFSIPKMYISDILEIIIIAVIMYYVILWFKKSRAWVLFKGIAVLVLFLLVTSVFHLTVLSWIINRAFNVGIIAIVIIFQPELRRALEELGSKNVLFELLNIGSPSSGGGLSDKSVEEITRAAIEMAKVKTGALIVIKQTHDLKKFEETGIKVGAEITSQILINIFEKNTPLHDGAVIIEGNKIAAATCYLPLSESSYISKDLGTRHRAAIGMTEETDSVVVIVSEETGSISIAKEGRLIRYADASMLKSELAKTQIKPEKKEKKRLFKKGKDSNEEGEK